MSLFDWLFGRRKPRAGAGESPPTRGVPTPPARPSHTPAVAPVTNESSELPFADPYDTEYLPITRAEIIDAARGGNLLSTAFVFGRQSVIPASADPRTHLIDRALVMNGLLTPEELSEIHVVGEEYEKARPTEYGLAAAAGLAGDAAVKAYREEKARRKARKKAEADARKHERALAVQRRRETDIIFLGRGVSGRLHLRLSDERVLAARDLPVMHAPADVAAKLGISIKDLRWLAFHTDVATRTHYIKFQVPKRSGGIRILAAPHKKLKAVQRWILANVVSRMLPTEAAHGFVAGRGILSNASRHVGKAVIVNFDLEDFFPSITFPRIRAAFERYGYSGSVATILALLCSESPRTSAIYAGTAYEVAAGPRALPQGAPTSPALSNQVARKLDRRMLGAAARLGMTYTRYADDLTFSGGEELAGKIGWLVAKVRHIAEEEGFRVNEKKTRVMRRSAAQTVTGVVVNEKPSIARAELRRLRAVLHRAGREGLEAQNRDGRPNFRAYLTGKIAFVAMIRPDAAARLRAALDAAR